MERKLKILMVLHMPWDRNLGGPRPQIDLADELRRQGHLVEKFDYNDAFPKPTGSKVTLTLRNFAAKARQYVEENAERFDVIDAHQGNLPYTKHSLGFKGLLVVRSAGLYTFHHEYQQFAKKKWPRELKGTYAGNFLRAVQKKRDLRYFYRSYQVADLSIVINKVELDYVTEVFGFGNKSVNLPNALKRSQHEAFSLAIQPAGIRLNNKTVVFIGMWSLNKGSQDWGQIVRVVKAQVPDVKFLFLGTGVEAERVLADLSQPPCEWIEIVPRYKNEDLPHLLGPCTVGGFPSYVEGFGLAVLEKLSCGLPTVAYDIPGPREMLGQLKTNLMVPRGNTEEFSKRIVEIVNMSEESYSNLSQECQQVAHQFSWDKLACVTLDNYFKFLNKLEH